MEQQEAVNLTGGPAAPQIDVASCLPRHFLTPSLLLLIDEEPAYGYELHTRLQRLGLCGSDHGSVYRQLNLMEADGTVVSRWERSSSGPRRRRYHVTDAGRVLLADWARGLELADHLILDFLTRWREEMQHRRYSTPAEPDSAEWTATAPSARPALTVD